MSINDACNGYHTSVDTLMYISEQRAGIFTSALHALVNMAPQSYISAMDLLTDASFSLEKLTFRKSYNPWLQEAVTNVVEAHSCMWCITLDS